MKWMEWVTQGQRLGVIIGGLIGIALMCNVGYQMIFPLEVSIFHSIVTEHSIDGDGQAYHPGEVVYYRVNMTKLYPAAATVVRGIKCRSGNIYTVLPNERGEGSLGEQHFGRHVVLPKEMKILPAECCISSVFSYDNINHWHKPIKYYKDSTWFKVEPWTGSQSTLRQGR